MLKYGYKIVTKDRKIKEGSLWAFSKTHAEKKVLTSGETVIFIQRVSFFTFPTKISNLSFGFSKFEQIIFFRNLSAMLPSGLSLVQALEISEEQVSGMGIKKALKNIITRVNDGMTLSKAMAEYPKYFPAYIVETIGLGELTGTLTETLDRISTDLERNYEISRKVYQSLAYPVIIVIVMIALVVVLMVMVLPKIVELFQSLGAPLPLPTKILYVVEQFISNNPVIIVSGLLLILTAFFFGLKEKHFRYAFHYLILKIPVMNRIIKEFNLVKFFRALETLIASGISWVEGVEIAKKTLNNDLYRRTLDTVHPILLHGGTLSKAISPYPSLFPFQLKKILEVGEQTGKFEETLHHITAYYDRSLRYLTQMMTSLIEPILMIVIGFVIGGLALSIFMPIYKVADLI